VQDQGERAPLSKPPFTASSAAEAWGVATTMLEATIASTIRMRFIYQLHS
jgi:hypothetical protein